MLHSQKSTLSQRRSAARPFCTKPTLELLEDRELLASNLFVATTGNDSTGLGTIDRPFATLARAVNVADPGDTIILRGGTYAGGVTINDPNITIKSYDGEWAVISAPINNSSIPATIRWNIDASGCKLQRVEVLGGYYYSVMTMSNWDSGATREYGASNILIEDCRLGNSGRDVVKVTPGSNDVIIRRCEIFNSGRRDPTNAEGIDNVNGDRMIVQDCWIHDITTTGIYPKGGAENCVIERNLITNVGQVGIMLGGVTDVEWFDDANTQYYESIDNIARNNIVMNAQMAGLGFYGSLRPQAYNNTLINVGISAQAAVLITPVDHYLPPSYSSYSTTPNRDVVFVNNIVTQSASSTRPMFEIRTGGLTGSLTLGNNIYYDAGGPAQFWDGRTGATYTGGFAGWVSHLGQEGGSRETNPLLDSNQHLSANSPAINAGRSVAIPGLDYDGAVKTGTLDIGADEYGAGTVLRVLPAAGTIGTGATGGSSGGGSSNRNPVAVNDSATKAEDAGVNIQVLANDSDQDGDALSISGFTQPSNGVVTNQGNGTLRYVPRLNWFGSDTFTYTISDGKGGTATATVSVTVTPVNDAPVAVNDSATLDQDSAVTLNVLANDSDVDGDALSVAIVTKPVNGSAVVNANGSITYTPRAGYSGADSLIYSVSDGKGGSATATVGFTVRSTGGGSPPPSDPEDSVGLETDPWDGARMALVVRGTSGNDKVLISPKNNKREVLVTMNGSGRGRFYVNTFHRIIVHGFEGNDKLEIALNVLVRSQLIGGTGDDVLLGGGGDDLLVGGDGSDRLEGRHGRDVLIGGLDADLLWGGSSAAASTLDGDDLLIGSSTSYDGDQTALAKIVATWRSSDSYANRLADLTGGNNDIPPLNTGTAPNDNAVDTLYGNSGLDWFFGVYSQDLVRDRFGEERVN